MPRTACLTKRWHLAPAAVVNILKKGIGAPLKRCCTPFLVRAYLLAFNAPVTMITGVTKSQTSPQRLCSWRWQAVTLRSSYNCETSYKSKGRWSQIHILRHAMLGTWKTNSLNRPERPGKVSRLNQLLLHSMEYLTQAIIFSQVLGFLIAILGHNATTSFKSGATVAINLLHHETWEKRYINLYIGRQLSRFIRIQITVESSIRENRMCVQENNGSCGRVASMLSFLKLPPKQHLLLRRLRRSRSAADTCREEAAGGFLSVVCLAWEANALLCISNILTADFEKEKKRLFFDAGFSFLCNHSLSFVYHITCLVSYLLQRQGDAIQLAVGRHRTEQDLASLILAAVWIRFAAAGWPFRTWLVCRKEKRVSKQVVCSPPLWYCLPNFRFLSLDDGHDLPRRRGTFRKYVSLFYTARRCYLLRVQPSISE